MKTKVAKHCVKR